MSSAEALRQDTLRFIRLKGHDVECRVVPSRTARKLRIKVAVDLVQVVLPEDRTPEEAIRFLRENEAWVVEQLARVKRLSGIRRPISSAPGKLMFRGEWLRVRVLRDRHWHGPNRVSRDAEGLLVTCAFKSRTPPATSLENWLRKEARKAIEGHLAKAVARVKRTPNRIYVMDQKTKWGNCSSLGNLSFNWRLILAPDFVLRYIVTHETVHLAVPDHSPRFWLTVQSLCPGSDRARQWLAANGNRLMADLNPLTPTSR